MPRSVFAEALGALHEHRAPLTRSLVLPFGVVLLVSASFVLELGLLGTIVRAVARLAAWTLVAVTTHRVLLLGPEGEPRRGLSWGRRETHFAAHLVVLGTLFWLLMAGATLVAIVLAYVVPRAALSLLPFLSAGWDSWPAAGSWLGCLWFCPAMR